jgi:hypothetical protein
MNDFLQSLRNGQAEKQRPQKTRKTYDNNPYHHTSSPRFHPYGNNPYNRNQQPMKRQPMPPHQGGNEMSMEETVLLADTIENLTSHVETLVRTQEYMASIQERTAMQLERLAIATERIVNHLNMAPLQENENIPEFENHYSTSQEETYQEDVEEEETCAPVKAKEEKPPVQPAAPARQKTKQVLRRRKNTGVQKIEVIEEPPVENNGKLMSREQVMDIIYTMRDQGATFDQVAKRLIDLGQPTFSGRGEWHAQTVHRLCNRK